MRKEKFATAINCMDGRVQTPVIRYLMKNYGVKYIDMITQPGPNKILAEGKNKNSLRLIKKCLEISVFHHGSKLIAVCGHFDCAGNPCDQNEQKKQTKLAIKRIKSWNFNVKIIGLWINQNWKVEKIGN
jgi:carbonic anhydrase